MYAGAAVVGLLIAGVAWLLLLAPWGTDLAGGGATGSARPGGSGSSTSSSTAPASTTSASSDPAASKAQRALATCKAHVAAGERLAQAAQVVARDWKTHTDAQRKLDSGAWTVAQAEAAWAESRIGGASHVRQFETAHRAVGEDAPEAGACRAVQTDTASTQWADEGRSCAARDKALAGVTSAGAEVTSQWKAHLEMMADMPHTDAATYRARWVTMVAQARPSLERYAAAATALERAPDCSP